MGSQWTSSYGFSWSGKYPFLTVGYPCSQGFSFPSGPELLHSPHFLFLQRYESPSDSIKIMVNDHIFHRLFHRFSGDILRRSELQLPGRSHSRHGLAESECSVFGPASEGRALAINAVSYKQNRLSRDGEREWLLKIFESSHPKLLSHSLMKCFFFKYCFLPIDGLIWGLKNGEKLHKWTLVCVHECPTTIYVNFFLAWAIT